MESRMKDQRISHIVSSGEVFEEKSFCEKLREIESILQMKHLIQVMTVTKIWWPIIWETE